MVEVMESIFVAASDESFLKMIFSVQCNVITNSLWPCRNTHRGRHSDSFFPLTLKCRVVFDNVIMRLSSVTISSICNGLMTSPYQPRYFLVSSLLTQDWRGREVLLWFHVPGLPLLNYPYHWATVRGIHRSPVNYIKKMAVMWSYDVLFQVCLVSCCTNSAVSGDWSHHATHVTSL